jgi:hypothetical protein
VHIGKGKNGKPQGTFSYNDPNHPLVFSTTKITSFTINGDHASFSGTAQIGTGKKKQQISFTVNVTANHNPATSDTFSISTSNSYSASGNLTSGSITTK